MKSHKNILIAFLLNLSFSIFEFFGGFFTGSVAIISDALHDMGDALGIGLAYFFEKKSLKEANKNYTYGYRRFSVLGSLITTLILIIGSIVVVRGAVDKIINPSEVNPNGMIIFAIIGVCVNLAATLFTSHGESLNQKAVNLHMLEDVLGWAVVLVGAIVIKFTNFTLIDPFMSIGVALFIFIHAVRNLKEALEIFLEKAPAGLDSEHIKVAVSDLKGIKDVHHIHVRTLDGNVNFASMHVVTKENPKEIKAAIRHKLEHMGISHLTLELEDESDLCESTCCHIEATAAHSHHHHHHHHH